MSIDQRSTAAPSTATSLSAGWRCWRQSAEVVGTQSIHLPMYLPASGTRSSTGPSERYISGQELPGESVNLSRLECLPLWVDESTNWTYISTQH